jgi:hypothetical protein
MADNKLDAIVHKSSNTNPRSSRISSDDLPVGITFLGRPYDESLLLKLAYSYEQSTHHRKPPKATPALP